MNEKKMYEQVNEWMHEWKNRWQHYDWMAYRIAHEMSSLSKNYLQAKQWKISIVLRKMFRLLWVCVWVNVCLYGQLLEAVVPMMMMCQHVFVLHLPHARKSVSFIFFFLFGFHICANNNYIWWMMMMMMMLMLLLLLMSLERLKSTFVYAEEQLLFVLFYAWIIFYTLPTPSNPLDHILYA